MIPNYIYANGRNKFFRCYEKLLSFISLHLRYSCFSLIFPHWKKKSKQIKDSSFIFVAVFHFRFYLLGIIFSFVERCNTVE